MRVQRDVGCAGHARDVVVLDQENVGILAEYGAQLVPSFAVDGGSGRVLAARGCDVGPGAAAQRGLERVGLEAVPVDGHRLDDEAKRMDEIADVRPARVLDDDPVAG